MKTDASAALEKMRLFVHIDRVVLPSSVSRPELFAAALRAELARLLALADAPRAIAGLRDTPRIHAGRLDASEPFAPSRLGVRAAQAIARSLNGGATGRASGGTPR